MATQPAQGELDRNEQIARISKLVEDIMKSQVETRKFTAETSKLVEDIVKSQAETRKITAETQFMPRTVIFQAMLATAALLGAGAAIAKLFFP